MLCRGIRRGLLITEPCLRICS
uniref:Uncharacterized protein n=1 Tax=Arundo donax TaxID=35708 RepID=A0A0A9AKC7_ARUDO